MFAKAATKVASRRDGESAGWLVKRWNGIVWLVRSVLGCAVFLVLLLAATVDGRVRHALGLLHVGPEGAVWIHGWCRRIVRALRIDCTVGGELPGRLVESSERYEAVVCNHLSYVDILLMSAVRPFVMVAKTEVRRWPLLGWLTWQAGTVYVERGGKPETYPAVNAAMAKAYRSGLPVLFFPEGTTTDGGEVLPFRRGLFHSVLRDRVRVRTAALRYELNCADDGASIADDVCWWGEAEFVPHLFRFLGLRGVRAAVRFGETVEGADRFELSENAQAAVSAMYRGMAVGSHAGAGVGVRGHEVGLVEAL
jgi:1-acyl-sn-glycerol-3-phosphate acyltransferase